MMTYLFLAVAIFAMLTLVRIANAIDRFLVGFSVIVTAMIVWLDHPDNPDEIRAAATLCYAFLKTKGSASAADKIMAEVEQKEQT